MLSARSDSDLNTTRPQSPLSDHPHRSATAVLAGFLLLMLMIAVGTWALIMQDWLRQQKVQETELSSLSAAVSDKLESVLGRTGQVLRSIAQQTLSEGANHEEALEAARRQLQQSNQLAAVSIWDPAGREVLTVHATTTVSAVTCAHASDRASPDSRRALRAQPAISGPDGNLYLPVAYTLRQPDGSPRLHLCGLIRTSVISALFASIRLTPDDSATLFDQDGNMLMQLGRPASAPHDFQAALKPELLEPNGHTSMSALLASGNTSFLAVFHWLERQPLIVASTRPASTARAAFVEMRTRLLVGMLALFIVLGLLAWLVRDDLLRNREARRALRSINESLEQRVQQRTAELEQSNRELIAFSHSVSHDLRAPLRAINGFAHALKEDYGSQLDERAHDYTDRICRASVRLGELIDELLGLANLSRTPLEIRPVDPGAMAHEIVEELRLSQPERKVVFECGQTRAVDADESLLRNALTNLIGNAWKFTRAREPGVISLAMEDDGEFKRFTLADNGIGFDMAHARRLFQPFQQLHADQGFGGSGIGLASTRRIIERHGGQIWAESRPGEGASFIFTLPVRPRVFRMRDYASRQAGN